MTKFVPSCLICNMEFYSKIALQIHLEKFHTKDEFVKAVKEWGIFVN